jgi:hypothetical protein
MYSTHEGNLNLPHLPDDAKHVHVVPALQDFSLVSLGQLCDAGCSTQLDKSKITVMHNNRPALTGTRTPATRLWHLNLRNTIPTALATGATTPFQTHHLCYAAIDSATPAQLVAFAHATVEKW